ncbi:MAG: hypothetical protein AAB864_00245 [Patescibacteria group bacterium]
MSIAQAAVPAAVQPIPLQRICTDTDALKACPGRFGMCRWSFRTASGFVPDLATLYEQVRGSTVDTEYPLTKSEVLSMELCKSCSHEHRFLKYGMQTFPTSVTLKLMESWAENNAQGKEFEQQRRRQQEEAVQRRIVNTAWRRTDDKGFVNETLATAPHRREGPHPKYRDHTLERQHFLLRKECEDTPVAPSKSRKRKKAKGGDQKNQRGKRH